MVISKPEKQITVNGVTVVKFDHLYPYFVIRNDGINTIFASTSNAECTEGADGVISIPTGTTFNLMNYDYINGNRTLYINGTGVAMVTGVFSERSFKTGGGGNDEAKITPQGLGYHGTPILFYDGIYNWGNYHKNNGAFWVDMITNEIMRRYNTDDINLIGENYYIKSADSQTSLRMPILFNDDKFTLEIYFEITNETTAEQDIINNFDRAGFGIFTQNQRINVGIFDSISNAYKYITPVEYEINTKYNITLVYNSDDLKLYVNGIFISNVAIPLGNYKKSNVYPFIGCVGGGGTYYAGGAYKLYRVAYHDNILSGKDILNNNGIDNNRFI